MVSILYNVRPRMSRNPGSENARENKKFSPAFLSVSPPAPSPSRRERGFHPVTRPFTLRRTARPLPSRGGVCSQRHAAKSSLGSALSVRCFPFYDSLRSYNACREQNIRNFGKAGSLRSSFTTQCKTYVRILRKSFALLCAAPKNQKKNLKKFAFVTIL